MLSFLIVAIILAAASDLRGDAAGRLARAEAIEEMVQLYHTPDGLVVDAMVEGDAAVGYGRTSDCGIWSGIYAGAAAARFAVLRDDPSRAALEKAIEGLHLLTAVTGVPGLYGRCAWRSELPMAYDASSPEIHAGAAGYGSYLWRGDVSQDQISGIIFGLGWAYDLADDPAVRAVIAEDLGELARHLMRTNLQIVDVDGEVTTFGNLRPTGITLFGLGVDGFVATMVLAIFRMAAHATGDPEIAGFYTDVLVGERHFENLVRDQLIVEVPDALGVLYPDAECATNYNNYNMMFLSIFNLVRLEEDPALLSVYRTAMRDSLWADRGVPPLPLGLANNREVWRQKNAFWTHIYYGIGPDAPDPAILAEAEEVLDLFFDPPLLPDAFDVTGTFETQCTDRLGEPMRKDGIVPLTMRTSSDFVWKNNPYTLRGGGATSYRVSGTDYLAAYWIGRYFGLLDEELNPPDEGFEEVLEPPPEPGADETGEVPDSEGDAVPDTFPDLSDPAADEPAADLAAEEAPSGDGGEGQPEGSHGGGCGCRLAR